jgi:hypothetical protein
VARDGKLTLRETALRFATRQSPFVGSPPTVADQLERWFREGAADGFIVGAFGPTDVDDFVAQVVPLLRQRGLFRSEYTEKTLRGHLGLRAPANRYATQPAHSAAAPIVPATNAAVD